MSTSVAPAYSLLNQNLIPVPGFDNDQPVTITRILRDITPPLIDLMPPRPIQWKEIWQLLYFQFQPPYSRDQYITIFNQFYMLIGRIPIGLQNQDDDMDFLAILVHREERFEETLMIPVPESFFEHGFYPDDTPSPSPWRSLSPSPLSSIQPSIELQQIPSHVGTQLGESSRTERKKTCWEWTKDKASNHKMCIFIFVLILIIFAAMITVFSVR